MISSEKDLNRYHIEFYPSIDQLEQKVDMIEAYVSSPHSASDIFKDLEPFVKNVRQSLDNLKNIEEELLYMLKVKATGERKKYISLRKTSKKIRQRILSCFQFFESGHQIYLRGTYADFSTDHQYGMSYIGNIKTVLKLLNYSTRKTFASLGIAWPGFITFSNFLNYRAAESSMIILPFFAKNSVEFISDWLLLTHEMGHIYFWDFLDNYLSDEERFDLEGNRLRLLDELLADFFCLEQGYCLDIIHMFDDFEQIRKRYQNPKANLFFKKSYFIRKLACILYAASRLNGDFKKSLLAIMRERITRGSILDEILNNYNDSIVDIVHLSSRIDLQGRDLSKYIKILFNQAKDSIHFWNGSRQPYSEKEIYFLELRILKTILDFCDSSEESVQRIFMQSKYVGRGDQFSFLDQVSKGNVVDTTIEKPFVFIKHFIDYCDTNKISLRGEEYAHVRIAAILTLSNQSYMPINI